MPRIRSLTFTLLALFILAACDPYLAQPTPQVVIITAIPSATPLPTPTPLPTATSLPSPTPPPLPSETPFPCDEPNGQIIAIDQFRSPTADENLRYRVYVPPCYGISQKRYPVVILLHGAGSRENQWEELGMLAAMDQGFRLGVLPPMILVMPYWGTIGNLSQFPPDPSYETVVLDELVPAIDRDFCTISNRDQRTIAGISRGGFWAFSVGLRHPDVFGIIAGHSPYFTEDLNEIPAAFNPLDLASNAAFPPDARLRIYLDNGADDPSGRTIQQFSTRLTERGIAHTYVPNPIGAHDDSYWSAHVSEYLTFYGRNWEKDVNKLPSCLEPSP